MLNDLLARLESERRVLSVPLLLELLEAEIPAAELAPWRVFQEGQYARNLIFRTERYEVLCLCWRPGQMSPPHDHGASCGAVRVIQGVALETVFDLPRASARIGAGARLLIPRHSSILKPGEVAAEERGTIHRFGNPPGAAGDLVTLHVYSPPLGEFRRYQECAGVAEAA